MRYTIDAADKTIDADPENHREIGISLVVTPTVLPDGTVRMKLRPRSAQIVEEIKTLTGNSYPRVTEAMVESITRVPDGFSLVIGGFYGASELRDRTKIPLLGDIPVINFFFKSKETSKERTSLVFIVTPKSYDPTNSSANNSAAQPRPQRHRSGLRLRLGGSRQSRPCSRAEHEAHHPRPPALPGSLLPARRRADQHRVRTTQQASRISASEAAADSFFRHAAGNHKP